MFSELYGAYYNAMASILTKAVDHPLEKRELRSIVAKHAFGESILNIEPALENGDWQLLTPEGKTPLKYAPTMPLTTLQKRWFKSILTDPRIALFDVDFSSWTDLLKDVEPLFTNDDFYIFDKYSDGDNYTNPKYIANFRLILEAVKNKFPIEVKIISRKSVERKLIVLPELIEYSEKDDKFRVICRDGKTGSTINIGRIISVTKYEGDFLEGSREPLKRPRSVHFELVDERKALERVMLHFAHFKKEVIRLEDNRYKVTVYYDKDDESEMVIRILSFGSNIKVTSPEHFVSLIKDRLKKQIKCSQLFFREK